MFTVFMLLWGRRRRKVVTAEWGGKQRNRNPDEHTHLFMVPPAICGNSRDYSPH